MRMTSNFSSSRIELTLEIMTHLQQQIALASTAPPVAQRYPLSDGDFRRIQDLVAERTGIFLSDDKRDLVYNRFSRRLRALQLERFSEYCDYVENDDGTEFQEFIDTITTNLTSFFRENHHFEYLTDKVMPGLLATNAGNRRIRIWSAGCSSGEEPYSIAAALCSFEQHLRGWDLKILATDLDSKCIANGKRGIYSTDRVRDLPPSRRGDWFRSIDDASVEMAENVRQLITFRRLNLMSHWPMKGPFDVLFCRNVVIYFDKPTQQVLFNRFADLMSPGGHLFVGHSENLNNVCDRFELIGKTVYRKVR